MFFFLLVFGELGNVGMLKFLLLSFLIVVWSWGIEVLILGSLMMFILGFCVILLSLVNVFGIFCLLERYFGKFVRMWVVKEMLFNLILMFVVVVNFLIMGSNE